MMQSASSAPTSNTRRKRVHKWLKRSLVILGILLLLLFSGWFVLTSYINNHKEQLLNNITERINSHILGKLEIKNMQPALWKSFPDISVRLDSVSLVDSLYPEHHLKTLALQSVFVKLNLFSFFSAHPKIKKITLSNGDIHLFTLQNGYSNYYLFEKKSPKHHLSVHKKYLFGIENVNFLISQAPHNKLFKIDCHKIQLAIEKTESNLQIHARMKIFVHKLGFNLEKGSYLVEKPLSANIFAHFDLKKSILSLDRQKVKIANTIVHVSARFNFGSNPQQFQLNLYAPFLSFKEGMSFLPKSISKKVQNINVSEAVSARVSINGGLQYPDTPFVKFWIKVKNNQLNTFYGNLKHATFLASFNNHLQKNGGMGDDNSGIFISGFRGEWNGIPITADSVSIINLVHPILYAKIKGNFSAPRLNTFLGQSFAISKGQVELQLAYSGPIAAKDTFAGNLNGYLLLKHGDLTYLPRSFRFTDCNAAFVFQQKDLLIKSLTLEHGKSTLFITGKAGDFLDGFFPNQKKVTFDCRLESPEIDLSNFRSILSNKNQFSESSNNLRKRKQDAHFGNKLDTFLDKSVMLFHLHFGKVIFDKFTANKVIANIRWGKDSIDFQNVNLQHAGGEVQFQAGILQMPKGDSFSMKGSLENLEIDRLFKSFNNFGQSTLKSENVKGILSADVSLAGSLNQRIKLVPNSLNGNVQFVLKNGELINFPPFLRISKFAFKNRKLKDVTFQTLSNDLTISNGKIQIPSMNILSNAFSVTVQGVYAFQKGTDISLKIPLRNPQKEKNRKALGLRPRKKKGAILYLKAQDGKDGKVHISWDSQKAWGADSLKRRARNRDSK